MATLLGSRKSRLTFLGEGIEYPFQLEWVNDNIDGSEVLDSKFFKKVRKALQMLIETKLGERKMLPDYGCRIHDLVFEPVPVVLTVGQKTLAEAVKKWEPRIKINFIKVNQLLNQGATVIIFDISYTIIKTNTPDNLVYPFYIQSKAS